MSDQGNDQGELAGRPSAVVIAALERQLAVAELPREVQAGERHALEILAAGAPLHEVLEVIVRTIEQVDPGATASLLVLGDKGTHFKSCIAPSLPEQYNRAIAHAAIGPTAGSCGTAASRRESVFVSDIDHDPLWDGYRALVQPYGLRACWSSPIFATDGRVLGTFAIYYREPRMPDERERELIGRATHVAGIAIERRQLDDQLRELSTRIEAIREDERTGIAREIHDELGQALTALKMDLAWIARRSSDPAIVDKLGEMSRSTDEMVAAIRRISAELRPGILDDLGLVAAIEWQAEQFAARFGIPCEVSSTLGELQLERGVATGVFRVFQESLTNVARHANATRVDVRLFLEAGRLALEVADDGVGVRVTSPSGSLGLLGMRERARRLGGDCEVRCGGNGGTIVALRVPLRFPKRRTESDAGIGV
jgi:signal transduction histidine kinase